MKLKITNPDFSVWVNASAGTGKTKILIDRVLRLLLENKKNILCLTLTNAAANEMENRIHNILSKWAICSNSELIASLEQLGLSLSYSSVLPKHSTPRSKKNEVLDHYIAQARKLFSELENLGLNIQTIHAFCYKLISSSPIEAGIAPNYMLSECKELHSIVFKKILHNKDLQDSINSIATEIDENKLSNLLYTLCVKRPLPVTDLGYIKEKLSMLDEVHDLENEITKNVERLVTILSKGSKKDQSYSAILSNWCKGTKLPAANTAIKKKSTDFILTRWEKIKIEDLAKVFLKLKSYERKSVSSLITKSTSEKFRDAELIVENTQNILSTCIKDINSYKVFKRTSNLFNIFKVYIDLYNSEKSKNALLDYNDIIDLAINLLSNPEYKDLALFNLNQEIDHILIDEAQDNNISQWKIVINLCDESFTSGEKKRTLFVVGDIKQSIYRFQGASPHLFKHMQQYFHSKIGNRGLISCQLEKSFRSAPEILAFADRIFNNFREEISLTRNEIRHIPHRENDQGYIEIWPLLPKCNKKDQKALQIHLTDKRDYMISDRLLAQAIAHRIHGWLSEGRILVTKDRNIEPKDIIILMRQRNMLIDYTISELRKVNVSVVGRDCFRIMDYIVVQDLIALAEFLLLPTNDLALANVLKSPLFNFSEDDLFNIAYNRKEHSLWEKLQNYSFAVFNELNYLIDLSRTESPLTLFIHVIYTSKKKFSARFGFEYFEVMDEFINLVLQFEESSLQAFIQWIKENNPEIRNDMQPKRNAVRIMTIHKSKGLQAPIVFLVDTNTVPRNNEDIVFDEMEVPFWCGKNANPYCDQVKKKKKLENYNEYLRLLYVALTRAEDELYILGKEPVQKGSWYDLITKDQELYEKKQGWLYPIFKEEVEVLCINANYPHIYKKLDCLNGPVVLPPQNTATLLQEPRKKEEEPISTFHFYSLFHDHLQKSMEEEASILTSSTLLSEKKMQGMSDGYTRGLIIHSILQYMPKIEKDRRKDWIKKYLDHINTRDGKDEIYKKILAFNEKYDYLFDLEGKSEIPLSGMVDGKAVLVRLDRLCITQNKAIIIDYKLHRNISAFSLNEIKKQMLTYKTLVQEIYPNKDVECVVIWVEDLTMQSDF
ncbi:AAA family ATPase [Wolbachia endosymbiont of Cruorifilaria tuberocauda]|uniref:UvrD-helicase domain-containing protein n=1 Tax=Wolbachia endosymbiont of Cruorifilaria tuberocauda TaxID=1812111 RepID=UPI0015888336|nr:UvrD-helicase domain-containing protein [Wolbachia endosymbiont of Cruorifilaria tuberocauda]QKX01729.1 AAA family ATPase [Wolbachia endosymbiont of Cruorifilaria tuberocauda]